MVNVAVFAGVLEYVNDLPALIGWLSGQVMVCIASYDCVRSKWYSVRRLQELCHRAYNGYLSYYTEAELIAVFRKSGFSCARTENWRDQTLFIFSRYDEV
jgi:hypothetical protein